MMPVTLSASALAAILHLKVLEHKSDASKVSLRGAPGLVGAFLFASGLHKSLQKSDVQKGKTYLWAHIPKSLFDAVAVAVPKSIASDALPFKTMADA